MMKAPALPGDCYPDVARLSFVSLAMLLKDIFEEQMGGQMDEAFLNELATFNGRLLVAGMAAAQTMPKGAEQ